MMLVLVEDREVVCDAYCASFHNVGQKLECFASAEYSEWIDLAPKTELDPLEGVLFGNCVDIEAKLRKTIERSKAPVIVLVEGANLGEVLNLFELGSDDIMRKPIHVREILCRIHAIRRRRSDEFKRQRSSDRFQVFFDGRDAVVGGRPLVLPRRERRLLEYFSANIGRRLTKDQLFNAVYGIFEDDVNESVIESHISKLRRKLRERIGYDPIDSKRHIGYCFEMSADAQEIAGLATVDLRTVEAGLSV